MGVIERGAKISTIFDFQVAGKQEQQMIIRMLGLLGTIPEITIGVFVGFDVPKSLGGLKLVQKLQLQFFMI